MRKTLTILIAALVAVLSLTAASALARSSGHDGSSCSTAKAYTVDWMGDVKGDTQKLHLKVKSQSSRTAANQKYKINWKTATKRIVICKVQLLVFKGSDYYHPKKTNLKSGKYSGKKTYKVAASQAFSVIVWGRNK